jgi:hypothetical protein
MRHPSSHLHKKTRLLRWIAAAFAVIAAPLLASCAVAPEKYPSTPKPEPTAIPPTNVGSATAQTDTMRPMSVDEAAADLERSERDLNRAVASLSKSPEAKSEELSPSPPPPVPTASPAAPPGVRNPGESELGDPCLTACRALASMRRSVDHLCGLTGDTDSRCEGARTRVEGASQRVRASCPACS